MGTGLQQDKSKQNMFYGIWSHSLSYSLSYPPLRTPLFWPVGFVCDVPELRWPRGHRLSRRRKRFLWNSFNSLSGLKNGYRFGIRPNFVPLKLLLTPAEWRHLQLIPSQMLRTRRTRAPKRMLSRYWNVIRIMKISQNVSQFARWCNIISWAK